MELSVKYTVIFNAPVLGKSSSSLMKLDVAAESIIICFLMRFALLASTLCIHLFVLICFVALVLIILISSLVCLLSSSSISSVAQKFVVARYVLFVLILFNNTLPGCHVSIFSLGPTHLQVLLDDSQFDGRNAAFGLSSQHSSSFFAGCFLFQCLQIGALLYILCLCSLLFFLPPFYISLLVVKGLFSDFTNAIISFIASVVFLIRISIWHVWLSVRFAMSSSVASACSSITFALYCLAVSLFYLFSLTYSVAIKDLMFVHVFDADGFSSHLHLAASISPDAFK